MRMYKYDKEAKTRGTSEGATVNVVYTEYRERLKQGWFQPTKDILRAWGMGRTYRIWQPKPKSGPNQMKYVRSYLSV